MNSFTSFKDCYGGLMYQIYSTENISHFLANLVLTKFNQLMFNNVNEFGISQHTIFAYDLGLNVVHHLISTLEVLVIICIIN